MTNFLITWVVSLLTVSPLILARVQITPEIINYLTEYNLIDHLEQYQESGVIHALVKRMNSAPPGDDRVDANMPQKEDFTPPEIKRLDYHHAQDDAYRKDHNRRRHHSDPGQRATLEELTEWWELAGNVPEEHLDENYTDKNIMDDDISAIVVAHFRRATKKVHDDKKHKFTLSMTVEDILTEHLTEMKRENDEDENLENMFAFLHSNDLTSYQISELIDLCILDAMLSPDGSKVGTSFTQNLQSHTEIKEKQWNEMQDDRDRYNSAREGLEQGGEDEQREEEEANEHKLSDEEFKNMSQDEFKQIFLHIIGEITHAIETIHEKRDNEL
jgi:hypothetical protein